MSTRTLSPAAAAANAIRRDLKDVFPSTIFSVRSQVYSMGNNVTISWTDGPILSRVHNIVDKYQMGRFNGMDDSYEYSNKSADLPQTKCIICNRNLTEVY